MNTLPLLRGSMFISPAELIGWVDRATLVQNLTAAAGKNLFGDDLPSMSVSGDVAIVPISGPLIKNAGFLERAFGAMGHEQIASDLDRAAGNASVKNIVLAINSPGGTVTGTPELAAKVSEIAKSKNVVAFTDSLMASAAYYIGAGARAIYATPSATIGSIGVMLEAANISEALKQRGVSVEVFTSGPLKGTGHPARPLTDEQRKFLQGRVDEMAGDFKSFVRQHRKGVADASMQGQTFGGAMASRNGLVDRVVSGLGDVLKELASPGSTKPKSFASHVADYMRNGMSKAQAVCAAVSAHPQAHQHALMTNTLSELDAIR